ncbi:hypothetical protein A9G34_00405 [Gilliamella sp. Choc4-2]|jgi:prepilin signal peptidase PulO-like enzyme (type II secretory pathway)|uniref:prepilin peptidase n=1 Tax=unclassified Gilliamella TaxID=2685620 RepID=UPI00080EBC6D|nr:hypothetical protein A9G33_03150 [Gilliamella apicola]OCG46363.1 hypothetical protein A9G34_00405 [Gilliamella apicola]OCG53715.1 hypothetical protein A9G36_09380 [Gilliamella apicola]
MIMIVFSLGLCFGSFIHVAYYRFSSEQSLFEYFRAICFNRSRCPSCQHLLTVWQLIPVLSWLILKRRCYYCFCKITYRCIIVEIIVAIIFMAIFLHRGIDFKSVFLMLLACYFLLLGMIDFQYYLLPNFFTQPLMWLGVLCAFFQLFNHSLSDAMIGILFGYLLLKIPAMLFYLITKNHGLGQGDIKLFAAFGAWVSYQSLPILLIIASLLGIVYFLFLRYVLNNKSLKFIPFGPFLLMSGYCFFYIL